MRKNNFFSYSNKKLHCEKTSLEKIALSCGTPTYVYSKAALLKPLTELQKNLKPIKHTICFAVKANSNLSVLKTLVKNGAGLDIVSGGELFRAKKVNTPAKKIVFSGVGKTQTEILDALKYSRSGIHSFNVESIEELFLLNETAKKINRCAAVAIRFNPDIDAQTHPYISTGLKKNKFGLNKNEVLWIAKNFKQFSHLSFNGISIHIGSQILTLKPLENAFVKTVDMIHKLNRLLPRPLVFADLGGGLGITYHQEKAPDIRKYCQLILKYFHPSVANNPNVEVFLEPGRLISGNAGALITQVLFRKKRKSKDFIVLDAAMNDLLRPALYQSPHQILPVKKFSPGSATQKSDFVGPVCESSDCFLSDQKVPKSLKQNDFLAICDTGAYGFTMASQYNSRCRPAEVLVSGSSFKTIRKRESYSDLIKGE